MKINIAIADDHTIFRKSLIRLFDNCEDFKVVADAANGKELLDLLIQCTDQVHVILLDLQMPVMDGMSCLTILMERYPKLKVIILSQLTSDLYVQRAQREGAFGFLSKEADPEVLIKTILLSQQKGAGFHSNITFSNEHVSMSADSGHHHFDFSKRELEVIYLSSIDLKNKDIARKLGISVRTVECHKNNLLKKTGCQGFLGVVIMALELRLITRFP
jgi:DNA-binding NarL/FixJ family response regulator